MIYNPLEDILKAREACRIHQKPIFVLPKWIIKRYGLTEEQVKTEFGENIIFIGKGTLSRQT